MTLLPAAAAVRVPLADFACGGCGYGIASCPPQSCPQCGSGTWVAWGSSRGADVAVRRLAKTIFLIRPPDVVDIAAGIVMCETVAALAQVGPEVVIDFTSLRRVEDAAAQFVLRLSALLRGAGGRLLVICSAGGRVAFHDLASGEEGGVITGELGRAVRRLAESGSTRAARAASPLPSGPAPLRERSLTQR